MKKVYRLTPEKLKRKILLEIDQSDSTISKVAKDHGIPVGRVYSWRQVQKKKQDNKISVNSGTNDARFIELSLEEHQAKPSILRKASLEFNDSSLLIEGKFSTEKVIQLIKAMEE